MLRGDGTVDFPRPPAYALPLGFGVYGGEPPQTYQVDFRPGERLPLYTDGVTEAWGEGGQFYPLEERFYLLQSPDAQTALENLREDVVRHVAGPLHDDAAMLLLRYRQR